MKVKVQLDGAQAGVSWAATSSSTTSVRRRAARRHPAPRRHLALEKRRGTAREPASGPTSPAPARSSARQKGWRHRSVTATAAHRSSSAAQGARPPGPRLQSVAQQEGSARSASGWLCRPRLARVTGGDRQPRSQGRQDPRAPHKLASSLRQDRAGDRRRRPQRGVRPRLVEPWKGQPDARGRRQLYDIMRHETLSSPRRDREAGGPFNG
jgi:hypothetical protein